MIKTENRKSLDGTRNLVYTYSSADKYVINEAGVKYVDAYDVPGSKHTYTESDEDLPVIGANESAKSQAR